MKVDINTEDFDRRFPPHRCKRCLRPLEAHFDDDTLELLWWEHGFVPDDIPPHDPEPEPADVSDVLAVCDFCMTSLDPGEEWTIPAKTFTVLIENLVPYTSCDNWAACVPCKVDYEARNWEPMVDRYLRTAKLQARKRDVRALMIAVWNGLVAHQCGEPIRGRQLHPEDGQHRG